jgi:mRNA-degrading endonuclease toxin of MazEF toxin-antitoxin module
MKRRYIPQRGDFVHMSFSPWSGRELDGDHFALVISNSEYNKATDMAIVLGCTSKDKRTTRGFQLQIPPGSSLAGGFVCVDAVRQVDCAARAVTFKDKANEEFVEEILDELVNICQKQA